jgi:hypothetical protein
MTPVISEKAFEDAIECALVLDFADPCLAPRIYSGRERWTVP